jgi:hypothetical protein
MKLVIRNGDTKGSVDALGIVIAFLKRYEITETVATDPLEDLVSSIPRCGHRLANCTFDDRVTTFAEELELTLAEADEPLPPKRSSPKKKCFRIHLPGQRKIPILFS